MAQVPMTLQELKKIDQEWKPFTEGNVVFVMQAGQVDRLVPWVRSELEAGRLTTEELPWCGVKWRTLEKLYDYPYLKVCRPISSVP